MALSDGQAKALDQLHRIAAAPGSALRIDYVDEPPSDGEWAIVEVSIDCRLFESAEGGLSLNARESIQLSISASFPYAYPLVDVAHRRFEGHPHVQWARHICLYQAPDTEWRPEGGMFDFMRRVHAWFRDAALNQLDADGAPLHPPAVYPTKNTNVCINEDTPAFTGRFWLGGAVLQPVGENRLDLNEWLDFGDVAANPEAAPAILLSTPFSFEYPKYVSGLSDQLDQAGIPKHALLLLLSVAAAAKEEGKPLHVVVGTPMRGIAGQGGERRQHLAVWEIDPTPVQQLALVTKALNLRDRWGEFDGREEIEELTDDIINAAKDWMNTAKVGWCRIMENRPEVTQRRDSDSALSVFKEKKVGLLGCGAIGGVIAEHLVRAGVQHIHLIDNSIVNPGILVRQNFRDEDVGKLKSDALKARLLAISPSLSCEASSENAYRSLLSNTDWTNGFDVVIDATASLRVRTKLEELQKDQETSAVIASLMVSSRAEHAAMAVAPPSYTGATLDVLRKLSLSVMNREHLAVYKEAFWSQSEKPLFQPEPGCSDPTFVGSAADVGVLSGKMLNKLAEFLDPNASTAHGLLFSRDTSTDRDHAFAYQPDILIKTGNGIDVRVSSHAWRDIRGWIKSGSRERGELVETGGLLFGEFNDVVDVLWINEVIGPPSDSEFSETEFLCGVNGTKEINEEKKGRTGGSVKFIGTWHSHPISQAQPSRKDLDGIAGLFATDLTQSPLQLMMIIGYASSEIEIGAYIFNRSILVAKNDAVYFGIESDGAVITEFSLPEYGKEIGLALSGGGSRAIAYHLGCLRALNDLGLLDEVKVVSGVSGGSVMTAFIGYTEGGFEAVDEKARQFLSRGLLVPSLVRLIFKLRIIPSTVTFLASVVPGLVIGSFRKVLQQLLSFIGLPEKSSSWLKHLRWPFRRWYSRTHIVAEELRGILGDKTLDAPTQSNRDIVFNACELATGTAFRMSNSGYGTWRFGRGKASDLRIADAVTASAAFPPALPAFDWIRPFENTKTDEVRNKRVILTDGGVYENLGVSCMEPGRSADYSIVSYEPEIIVSCDAGAGQMTGEAATGFWPFRMLQTLQVIHRKVQDAAKGRLHKYAETGELEAFIYSGLGQMDARIPVRPSVWVSREDVMDYPTDFSAMKEHDLVRLAARGEHITRTLVSRYLLT